MAKLTKLVIVAVLMVAAIIAITFLMGGRRGAVEVGKEIGGVPVDEYLEPLLRNASKSIDVSSPAFTYGSTIPTKYTCDSRDVSIPIHISNVPSNAVSLLVVMYDPDAPRGTFYHWVLYNVPPNISSIPEAVPKQPTTFVGTQAKNDFGFVGYGGPCPPKGSTHRYFILVLALDTKLSVEPGSDARKVLEAARGHVIAYGYTMGRYGR